MRCANPGSKHERDSLAFSFAEHIAVAPPSQIAPGVGVPFFTRCMGENLTTRRKVQLRCEHDSQRVSGERVLYDTLTWRQRQTAKRSTSTKMKLVSVEIEILKKTDDAIEPATPPAQEKLAGFMARLRSSLKENTGEVPPCNAKPYAELNFEFLEARLNASLGGSAKVTSKDQRLNASDLQLRAVNIKMGGETDVVVPLVCPKMLKHVLNLLPQPWDLKLSMDGTFRLLFGGYVLITVGVIVKTWSRDGNLAKIRST